MTPQAEVILRATGEHATLLAIVDAAGTALVIIPDEEPFQVAPGDWMYPWEKHAGCGCCG